MNRVAHRDIKIENILISEQQNNNSNNNNNGGNNNNSVSGSCIKLCDFGFSKLIETTTTNEHLLVDERSTTFCGSLAYCAPEILLRTPYDPWKTDVWSLGVVLYKMVVGVMPFGEGNDLASVRKITRAQSRLLEFPPFPPTTADCQHLIRSLLTVESSQRITLFQVSSWKAWLVVVFWFESFQ